VIVDHQRTHVFPEMIAAFQEVIRQRQGITEAQVPRRWKLNKAQKRRWNLRWKS